MRFKPSMLLFVVTISKPCDFRGSDSRSVTALSSSITSNFMVIFSSNLTHIIADKLILGACRRLTIELTNARKISHICLLIFVVNFTESILFQNPEVYYEKMGL